MKRVESESPLGLSREYFHYLINQRLEMSALPTQNEKMIDEAIEQTTDLVKKVLEYSFELSSFNSIAEKCNLTVLRVRELYRQGLDHVCVLLERQLDEQQGSENEID